MDKMREALDALNAAGDELLGAWDEDRVEHYPPELGDLAEVVQLLHTIRLGHREESLARAFSAVGLAFVGQAGDWMDPQVGVLYVGEPKPGETRAWVGIDYALNGAWQVILYWNDPSDDERRCTPVDLSPDGLGIEPHASVGEAMRKLAPLVAAITGRTYTPKRRTITATAPWNGETVTLEAWPEHGCYYEVGHADERGASYVPMMADGSPEMDDDGNVNLGVIEDTYAEASGHGRGQDSGGRVFHDDPGSGKVAP